MLVVVRRPRRVKEAVLCNTAVRDCGADTRREPPCARLRLFACVGAAALLTPLWCVGVRVMIILCNDTSCLTTLVTSTHLYSYPCLIAPPPEHRVDAHARAAVSAAAAAAAVVVLVVAVVPCPSVHAPPSAVAAAAAACARVMSQSCFTLV